MLIDSTFDLQIVIDLGISIVFSGGARAANSCLSAHHTHTVAEQMALIDSGSSLSRCASGELCIDCQFGMIDN